MRTVNSEVRDRVRAQMLDSPQQFSAAWASERVVVAAAEVDDAERDRILAALAPSGEELLCLTTDDGVDSWTNHAVTAAPSEVGSWRTGFPATDVLVARTDLSAAFLDTVDEFVLIAGPPETVEKALARTVDDARADFASYAQSMKGAARHLPDVARQYSLDADS